MRQEKEAGTKVVDVDGSHLHRKQQSVGAVGSDTAAGVPGVPLTGWESIDSLTNLDGLPKVTHGMVYTK